MCACASTGRPPFSEFLQSTSFAYAADVGLRLHSIVHIRTRKLRGKEGRGPVAKALCLSESVHCDPSGRSYRPYSSCADENMKRAGARKVGRGGGGLKGWCGGVKGDVGGVKRRWGVKEVGGGVKWM